ncbi:10030_t:CDS:2, partial [Acaulospora morrowiae]
QDYHLSDEPSIFQGFNYEKSDIAVPETQNHNTDKSGFNQYRDK